MEDVESQVIITGPGMYLSELGEDIEIVQQVVDSVYNTDGYTIYLCSRGNWYDENGRYVYFPSHHQASFDMKFMPKGNWRNVASKKDC